MKYSDETIALCRSMFLRNVRVTDIERETKVPRRTLYTWINKLGWDSLVRTDSVMDALNKKLLLLLEKENLTETDLNAIERLTSVRHREMKTITPPEVLIAASDKGQQNAALNPENIAQNKRKARKGNRTKNDLTGIDPSDVEQKFKDGLFAYQLVEWENRKHRRRFYLKSRQIGWTYYCAREAFADAVMTGTNQAFLSASKNQSQQFRTYIQSFAMEWFDVELKGSDKITMRTDHGDVTLYFLSTNSSTAQGYSGNVYLDECFWIRDFQKLETLASAIASQKKYRKTYFSTPSTQSHDAYQLWCGNRYKKIQEKRPELSPFTMPSKKQLLKGCVSNDGMYRKIITIQSAIAGGCDMFDIKELELEYAPDVFAQLFECKFIDDTNSAFYLNDLLACARADTRWPDFKPNTTRPFGNRPVWVGYDPSRSRDSAVVAVLAPPSKVGGKFRLLEKHVMNNQNWTFQADTIKAICDRYNVQHIGIDTTGPGNGVFERVQEFFPAAMGIHYTQDIKTRLVLKGQEVVSSHRIEWDEQHTDIPMAFMAIHKASTGNGITYVAKRDNNIGHADAAWAIMHALYCEGLGSSGAPKSSYILAEAA